MRLTFAGAFAEANQLWNANRDLLVRIAGVFYFLPALAVGLFLPMPAVDPAASSDEQSRVVAEFLAQNWPAWLGGLGAATLVGMLGNALIFILLFAPGRPSLGEALRRVMALLPALLVTWVILAAAGAVGLFLLILPALYLMGRSLPVLPVLAAEPDQGPIGAIAEGFRRTHGNGWRLLAYQLAITFSFNLIINLPSGLLDVLGRQSPVAVVVHFAMAALAAVGALTQAMLQASAYRLLSPATRQGM